jgi:hypothetical protein
MLQDNYRALSLTKKMGFKIDYLTDGTVKATLNLKEEDIDLRCELPKVSSLVTTKEQPKVEATEAEKRSEVASS